MKTNNRVFKGLFVCGLAVCLIAVVYLCTRKPVESAHIELVKGDQVELVSVDDIASIDVHGETVNGKGDIHVVDEKGIFLNDLLKSYKIESFKEVDVVADDAYQATVSYKEVTKENDVYLTVVDEEVNMIVFSDHNSKRNVRNVIRVIVK